MPNPTDRWDYDQAVTYEPSGMLALVIRSGTWDTRILRTKWSDAKIQRIEKLIPDFVAGLIRTAVVLRQKEEETKAARTGAAETSAGASAATEGY